METSVRFAITAKDDFSYSVIKAIYQILYSDPTEVDYWDGLRIIWVENMIMGGVYVPVEDVRIIKYILAKYGILGVSFSVEGDADLDYGSHSIFDIRYSDGIATIAVFDHSVYWVNEDGEEYEYDDPDFYYDMAKEEFAKIAHRDDIDDDHSCWSIPLDTKEIDKKEGAFCKALIAAGIEIQAKNDVIVSSNPSVKQQELAETMGKSFSTIRRVMESCTPMELNILKIISSNPSVKQRELAEATGKSVSTIRRVMKSLQDKNYVRKEGDKRSGKWELLI
jgi:predicted transcriptional regulator